MNGNAKLTLALPSKGRLREAAEAMGATRWQVIWKVVLPAAKNGLLGAVLLVVHAYRWSTNSFMRPRT